MNFDHNLDNNIKAAFVCTLSRYLLLISIPTHSHQTDKMVDTIYCYSTDKTKQLSLFRWICFHVEWIVNLNPLWKLTTFVRLKEMYEGDDDAERE